MLALFGWNKRVKTTNSRDKLMDWEFRILSIQILILMWVRARLVKNLNIVVLCILVRPKDLPILAKPFLILSRWKFILILSRKEWVVVFKAQCHLKDLVRWIILLGIVTNMHSTFDYDLIIDKLIYHQSLSCPFSTIRYN